MRKTSCTSGKRRRHSVIPAAILLILLSTGCMRLFSDVLPANSVAAVQPDGAENIPLSGPDRVSPTIDGAADLVTYVGDNVSYLEGITATDDRDLSPSITVDSSAADLSRPGTYEIIYTAEDSAGNTSSTPVTLTVLEKGAGFVDMETINTAADELLDSLLWDGITTEEQVRAIYRWARSQLCYAGRSDRTDWRQTAYTMLTRGSGDCYGYFAVTKLLFERLGIPNIDVHKVKNSENDSDHFWSLVSVDGGETYYHFDATPRMGDGDDFCLVTDAFLDDYSASHKNSHNRDRSAYPATPED